MNKDNLNPFVIPSIMNWKFIMSFFFAVKLESAKMIQIKVGTKTFHSPFNFLLNTASNWNTVS